MNPTPICDNGSVPTYSAEDYELAKQIKSTYDHIKKKAINVWKDPKKRLPIEAELILEAVKILKSIPIPQLKLIIVILLVVVAIIILFNKFVFTS